MILLNSSDQVTNVLVAKALASVGTLVKNQFPSASVDFSPWRDDPSTQFWHEEDSLDLSLHFPGWTPRYQSRSILIQLQVAKDHSKDLPRLLGVIMRGLTFEGERWKLVTVGDWQITGSHLPQRVVMDQLHEICRNLFTLFPSD